MQDRQRMRSAIDLSLQQHPEIVSRLFDSTDIRICRVYVFPQSPIPGRAVRQSGKRVLWAQSDNSMCASTNLMTLHGASSTEPVDLQLLSNGRVGLTFGGRQHDSTAQGHLLRCSIGP